MDITLQKLIILLFFQSVLNRTFKIVYRIILYA